MKALLVSLLLLSGLEAKAASDLGSFLKNCAWGTLFGAGAGAVSLAFESKPSEHTNNIARGASLGLYAGIAYGLLQAQEAEVKPTLHEEPVVLVIPTIQQGKVDGVAMDARVFSF